MERRQPPWAEIGVTLAGVALLAAIVVAVDPLRDAASAAIQGDHEEVRDQIDRLGVGGPLLILTLALLALLGTGHWVMRRQSRRSSTATSEPR